MVRLSKARITATGSYVPKKVLSNSDLERMVETSDDWIYSRTGIKERRIAGPHEYPSDMGSKAAKQALAKVDIKAGEIELIITATMSPDYISPSTAVLIQRSIGADKAAAVDVQAACTGYLYALSMAKAYVESGLYKQILVVATEKMSSFIDYQDRNTCVLFGDGAAASLVSTTGKGMAIDALCLGADGNYAELIEIPAGGARIPASEETVRNGKHFLKMQGKEVFKHAIRQMSAAATECLRSAGLTHEDIRWLVPHQANERIIDAIAKSVAVPLDKVFKTVQKYGNTSSSSIAIALDELFEQHEMKKGEHVLLVAFGGGLTWGASLLTKM